MAIAVDFHAHCFPVSMVPEGIHRARAEARIAVRDGTMGPLDADGEAAADAIARKVMDTLDDPMGDALRSDLEGAGLTGGVVIGLDWSMVGKVRPAMSVDEQIEWASKLVERHSGFFAYVFGIDPRREQAREATKRALECDFVSGVKLYPPAGFSPSDEICDPIYDAVTDAGAFVMFHTGWTTYPFDMQFGRVEAYSSVQRRYPGMRLVLGHAGYPYWGDVALRVASAHGRTAVEVSNWHHEVPERPERAKEFLKRAWAELGPGRVLFGTDHVATARRSGSTKVNAWRALFEEAASDAGVDLEHTNRSTSRLLARC